jgi:hypothetical protein
VALRLSHVLVLMALVLAAGVLSVRRIEGESVVQGTLVIAAPGLTPAVAQRLQRERGDLGWTLLPVGDGPLAPFDTELVAESVGRGTVVSLFLQPPLAEPATRDLRGAWRVLIAPEAGDVLASLAAFVRAQVGTRPFLAGLLLPPSSDAPALAATLEPLLAAADALPTFRRTSIVLLGDRPSGPGRRVVARLDRGRGALAAPVTLADLLERGR